MADVFWNTFLIISIVFLALAGLGLWAHFHEAGQQADTKKALQSQYGENIERTMVSRRGGQGVSYDPAHRLLTIVSNGIPTVIKAEEVISAEIIRDGQTLVKTNRGSQAAGVIVGAALLGPVGLLVGGVTGSKSYVEKVRSLKMRIITGGNRPYMDVTFYSGPAKLTSELHVHLRAAENALSTVQAAIGAR